MKLSSLLTTLCLLVLASCATQPQEDDTRNRPFSDGWLFLRSDPAGAEATDFDDAAWTPVDLPHDFSILPLPGGDTDEQIGPFSKHSPGPKHTGHAIGGTGWYRKAFTVAPDDDGKRLTLVFDGAYMETDVYVNGQKVGDNKYGYSPFGFDITPLLRPTGEENVVAVRVDNPGANSRWYSGSGLYRDVSLLVTDPVHIDLWGVQVTTPDVAEDQATVSVAATVRNDSPERTSTEVHVAIVNPRGKTVAEGRGFLTVSAGAAGTLEQDFSVEQPVLWGLDNPALYRAVVTLKQDDEVVDTYSQKFGIRSISFSAEEGFLLNGQPVLLKGGCMHHDNGYLGAAAIRAAERHRIALLKQNGYNAVRCSHNPPSQHFLDACDEMGLLVLDEFVDMWDHYKNKMDYHRYFNERWESDLTRMLLRDRNHPSIVIWSIGNEVPKVSIDEGIRIGSMLKAKVDELDGTRPVTEAIPSFVMWIFGGWQASGPLFDLLDIGGYNYMDAEYEADHEKYPHRIILGTESYGLNAYNAWTKVERLPYVIGDFVWTAMDYIGEVSLGKAEYVKEMPRMYDMQEAGPKMIGIDPNRLFDMMNMMNEQASSNWPDFLSGCGDLDIIGQKKSQGRYRDVLWGEKVVEMNVHEPFPEGLLEKTVNWDWPREYASWNWAGSEGQPLQVRVFTRQQAVRLELNGEVVGEHAMEEADEFIATFDVPYQPGTLTAIALDAEGKEVGRTALETTGEAVALRLTVELPSLPGEAVANSRSALTASRADLAYVRIDAIDDQGRIVPTSDLAVDIAVGGAGERVASGNAAQDDMLSVNRPHVRLYRGQAQLVVRPYTQPGTIDITVSAPGLPEAKTSIAVR